MNEFMKEQNMSDLKVQGVEANDIIKRRIRFLLDAAKHELKKDQVVTYAMRVLSNHATIGKDAGSAEIKKQNKTVSVNAKQLLYSADLATYCQNTINEHPKPIQLTWEWLKIMLALSPLRKFGTNSLIIQWSQLQKMKTIILRQKG